jgi:isocitrate dehydrogenase kinase/phosphatase
MRIKAEYSQRISACIDYELAETFFNSVTRRVFATVGVDPDIEFVDSDFAPRPPQPGMPIYTTYPANGSGFSAYQNIIQAILADFPFEVGYQDLACATAMAASEIEANLPPKTRTASFVQAEMLSEGFFRGKGCYLVGRLQFLLQPEISSTEPASAAQITIPLVIALLNQGDGIFLDAVLLDEDEVSVIFSFTRSYFHVEVERPHEMIDFLKSLMPLKRIAELYISIGYNKHGKTELYRELLNHLSISSDSFVITRGERGMVMLVFDLPSYDMVFKVIKDRADPPKATSRREVMEHYDLVFKHDRAGRLVDAQEFEHLRFDRMRFSEELLQAFAAHAADTVTIGEDFVAIKHLYTERRLAPLNLFIKEASKEAARLAIIDYGQAIKDLAATNIFPGDVLLKNFGVTRHGRVVFYDYDELCLVTDCKFRNMPQARSFDDEFESDPWFYVGPLDIFPEEFRTFLGLQEPLREYFTRSHEDIFDAKFWKDLQKRHRAGDVVDIFPYAESRHLVLSKNCHAG